MTQVHYHHTVLTRVEIIYETTAERLQYKVNEFLNSRYFAKAKAEFSFDIATSAPGHYVVAINYLMAQYDFKESLENGAYEEWLAIKAKNPCDVCTTDACYVGCALYVEEGAKV